MLARRRLGLALLAAATLAAELALTRLLSVSHFHPIAFLVVSTAMLGTGAGAVLVRARGAFPRRDPDRLAALACLAFAVGLVPCFVLAQATGAEPLALAAEPAQLLRVGALYLLLALPLGASGFGIALLLARAGREAPSVYAADLAGAGLGSLLGVLLLEHPGGPGALVVASALAALGAACFTGGRLRPASLTLAVVLLGAAPWAATGIPLHLSSLKVTPAGEPMAAVLTDPARHRGTWWSAIGRVDRVDFGRGGERLLIDGGVAAVRIPTGTPPRPSETTLPDALRPGARVLIIGAGAGWEIAEALAFGAARVDAVEVSPQILAHVPDALARRPEVHLHADEARSFLERHPGPWDAIVAIHTLSNAATASGALHLAEDHLLTREAFAAMLARLAPGGLLLVTRPEAQLPRLLVTLRAAALALDGAPPELLAFAERRAERAFYAGVLLARGRFLEADHPRIEARFAALPGLQVVVPLAPAEPPSEQRERSPVGPALPRPGPADPLLAAIQAGAPTAELEAIAGLRLDVPTDDRPFFHQRARLSELRLEDLGRFFARPDDARGALESAPLAELSALLLLAETTAIGALVILWPLRRRRDPRRAPLAPGAYYAALGVAFMLVEVALVQQLRLLLGQPILAFAVVFSGLLLGAGAGSSLAGRLARPAAAPLAAAAAVLAIAFGLPALASATLGASEVLRVAVALAVVLPTGFALGLPFPRGLVESARPSDTGDEPAHRLAWAFALNAVASISGTVLALLLAPELGLRGLLVAAALLYVCAATTSVRLGPRTP